MGGAPRKFALRLRSTKNKPSHSSIFDRTSVRGVDQRAAIEARASYNEGRDESRLRKDRHHARTKATASGATNCFSIRRTLTQAPWSKALWQALTISMRRNPRSLTITRIG